MWSFVGLKHNKKWIWLAPDSDSREIVGMHVGSRDRAGAEALWKSLPPVSRFFPKTNIEQLVEKTEKRTALKGSTLH